MDEATLEDVRLKAPTTDRDAIVAGLDDYDWESAFEYAGTPPQYGNNQGGGDLRACVPGSKISLTPFERMDVAEVIYIEEGERDERPWLLAGRLDDGRWFLLEAGCDYTGWD